MVLVSGSAVAGSEINFSLCDMWFNVSTFQRFFLSVVKDGMPNQLKSGLHHQLR